MRYRLREEWAMWERRTSERLTHRELAKKANISMSTLHKVLNNENVNTDVLERLAGVFGIHVRDLFGDDPDDC